MNPAIDPWVITPRERVKYQEYFKALQPQNGIVTGQQARGFFLQSNLPTMVLGEIWSLADTDSDGKMNINEFSIACKLINLKLRNIDIPKKLPPTLVASLTAVGGTPTLTPTGMGSLSPMDSIKSMGNSITAAPNQYAAMQIVQPLAQTSIQPVMTQQQPLIPGIGLIGGATPLQQPIIPGIPSAPILTQAQPIAPIIPSAPMVQMYGGVAPTTTATVPIIPSMAPTLPQSVVQPMISPPHPLIGIDAVSMNKVIAPTSLNQVMTPAPSTPPHSGHSSRSMSLVDQKAPSIESPGAPVIDWAVKGPAKLKYTQLFNTTDRTRSGYLTGAQARNLMVQSKLPQSILATIWALADLDSDSRLGCEEFVLAMYLCDQAVAGEAIPNKLPADLIPPSFRKGISRHGSIASSRHSSVSSQGAAPIIVDADPAAGLPSQTSFEDKRKENYDKGQAELERRRKVLADMQRKEQEERERKEREEQEKREKALQEIERKRQEELERQLQRQKEIEQEKEEKRKREIEQKEAARKEMEKQRQLEWEKQRIAEMQLQRQNEQVKVLKLKAQNQTYTIEQSTLNEKIKELSQKICDTRANVANVKTVIDGMRATRDSQMSEMATLKGRIKDQNQKLVQLSQEKAKLDNKNKGNEVGNQQQAFTNKQILINQLRGKLDSTISEVATKHADINTNTEQLTELKTELGNLINTCEDIYAIYDQQRNQLIEMKNNRKNDSITTSNAWDTAAATTAWHDEPSTVPTKDTVPVTAGAGYVKYRAIYEFYARNADEITFQPGDFVMVPIEQNAEPGWLAGEINGHTGWFPETYVEKVESPTDNTAFSYNQESTVTNDNKNNLPDAPAYESTPSDNSTNVEVSMYVAIYPYESTEIGDLVFNAGEMINVLKKEGDWWTGQIDTRVGIFPSNYVQSVTEADQYPTTVNGNSTQYTDTTGTTHSPDTQIKSPQGTQETFAKNTNIISEDTKIPEDTDIEVSEINYQPNTDQQIQDTFSRPMSTSSTTTGLRKKGEVAQVIAPYEATSTEQLSLQKGQLIMIRKKTDSGWWEGELQARGRRRQIGWFPGTYVKVLQSGRLSGRSTPVSGGKVHMDETVLDKVIALYPYTAQNDDELSFQKDDIISVLGRDEPEWWRGECQGLTGLFPSNYVGPFVTSGNP